MKQTKKQTEELDLVTIRFAGDSGDGMQLTGNQFTENSAIFEKYLLRISPEIRQYFEKYVRLKICLNFN